MALHRQLYKMGSKSFLVPIHLSLKQHTLLEIKYQPHAKMLPVLLVILLGVLLLTNVYDFLFTDVLDFFSIFFPQFRMIRQARPWLSRIIAWLQKILKDIMEDQEEEEGKKGKEREREREGACDINGKEKVHCKTSRDSYSISWC